MQLALHRCSEPVVTVMTVTPGLLFARCQARVTESGSEKQSPRGSHEGGTATEPSMGIREGDA